MTAAKKIVRPESLNFIDFFMLNTCVHILQNKYTYQPDTDDEAVHKQEKGSRFIDVKQLITKPQTADNRIKDAANGKFIHLPPIAL